MTVKRKMPTAKALSLTIAIAMILTLFTGITGITQENQDSSANPINNIERLAGDNRYETSAKVALEGYDDVDHVIIARGDDEGEFADGLSASILAGALDAPILLTRTTSLPGVIESAIEDLGAREAIILGGEGAVSTDVETELLAMGLNVERIAGETRIETASLIAQEASKEADLANFAFVVNGYSPADSLAAGPSAFDNKAPILQVTRDRLPSVTVEALEVLEIEEIFVVGGTAVISDVVYDELSQKASVTRLAGPDRYATSVEVAKAMFPDATDYSIVGGFNYADAIGAAVFSNPIIFVRQEAVPAVANDYLDQVLTDASLLTIFGGTVAISPGVVDLLTAKVEEVPEEDIPEEEPPEEEVSEEYTLSIDVEGEGTTEPSVGTHTYEGGEEVNIVAIPAENWDIVEWKGDLEGTEAEITITMEDNISVIAVFENDIDPVDEVTAGDLDVEINTLVPGAYNVMIPFDKAADLLGATEDDDLKLNINGEVIELEYDEDTEEFYRTNVQGYTEDQIKQAVVTR